MKQLKYKCLLLLMAVLCCVTARATITEEETPSIFFVYIYNDEAHTASIWGSYGSTEDAIDLVIPSTSIYEENEYTVTEIAAGAFYDRTDIATLTIPSTVTTIGESAFTGCLGLTSISVAEGNPVYDSRNDCNALIETATNTILYGCSATVIPEGITAIADDAFAGVEISSISFPSSITSIGSYNFFLTNLEEVYCHATRVPTLGTDVFMHDDSGKIPATLYVPKRVVEAYKSAEGWKDFREITAIPVPVIPAPVVDFTELEYFVNTDPGLGKGTLMSLSTDEEITQTVSIPASELQFGLNKLGLRLKTTFEDGRKAYSPTMLRYVYRYHAEDAETSAIEYFVGKDPGIGKGVRVPIEPDEEGNVTFDIPETALRFGLNTLGLRLISTHNGGQYSYSPTVLRQVYRFHAEDAQTVGVEYFLNTDPGIGKANFISATGDEVSFDLPRGQMKEGINVLGLRAISRNSETGTTYSATHYQYVYRSAAFETRYIERVEYFWDEDPGQGNATAIDFVNDGEKALVESLINYRGLYGTHVLNVRALSHGVWTQVYSQTVNLPEGILEGDLTLDPNAEEDTDIGIFNSLGSLISALCTRGFTPELNVNVADATYSFQVTEQSLLYIQSLRDKLTEKDFYISMKAPNSATFNFVMPEEFILIHQEDLSQIVASVQALFSHIVTENISILINGQPYEYDGFQVDPNDLLALKNLYNRLGGENWTQKQWSFRSNGRDKSELPGVEFNEQGRVTGINLSNNNLVGKLTKDYNLLLPMLTSLNLSRNSISGDLAPFVEELGSLKSLDVSFNLLSEISSPLPEGLTTIELNGQYMVYQSIIYEYTGLELREEWETQTPILVYYSKHQQIDLPTFITYNIQTRSYDNHPTLRFGSGSGSVTSIYYSADTDDYGYYPSYYGSNNLQPQQDNILYMYNDRMAVKLKRRYIMGDANLSGYTDVLDVQHTLNRIMGALDYTVAFNISAADTYTDEIINVQDIVCTVNIVLDNEQSSNTVASNRAQGMAEPQAWLYTADGRLMLATSTEVGALDIELQGVSTSQVSLLLNHSQFQMMGRNTEKGSRYVIFSPTGQAIPAGEINTLLKVSGNARIVAAQVSDMTAEEIAVSIGQVPTGIGQVMDGTLAARFQGNQLVVKAHREMSDVQLRLTSTGGAVLFSTTLDRVARGETALNVNVMPGIYVLEMMSANGTRRIVKLMKR
jgi:hypothetical protein